MIQNLMDRKDILHMNYKIGELVNYEITGSEKITGINVCKNGDYRFSLANGLTIDGQYITGLSEPTQPEQPKQEDKPKFKVGDRVKIVRANLGHKERKVGDVCEIESIYPNGTAMWEKPNYGVGNGYVWFEDELEPYTEPEYYSGKVVCVANTGRFHTVGKVYEIKDGIVNHDSGDFNYNKGNPMKSVEQLNADSVPQFIEFKGEL
jgi:hypothetical protein